MKSMVLVAALLVAGCSKKSEKSEPESGEPQTTVAQPMATGAGPIADLQAEYSTNKKLAGTSIRLAGTMLNYGTTDGVTYLVVSDRKTQMKPNIDCVVMVTKEALDAMNLQQFDRVVIEGTVATSKTNRAELKNCTVSKEQ